MNTKRNLVCGFLGVSILLLAAVPAWAGLVSKWPADGNANDIADGNHGTEMYGAGYAPGYIGQAFLLDGIDDCVHVPDSPSLDITEAITIVAWIYPTEIKTQEIVRKGSGVPPDPSCAPYSLALSGTNDFVFSLNIDGEWTQCRESGYPINTWTHFAGTFDGTTMRIYVNGDLKNYVIKPGVLNTASAPLLIGTRTSLPADTFKGKIDEAAIYNHALDRDEIRALFSFGGLSQWVYMIPGAPDLGYSLNEADLVYFYSFNFVQSLNSATGGWSIHMPTDWVYFDWPFYYESIPGTPGTLWFALPPESGLWVYHFSIGQWEVLPRIIP
ncbi:MAG: LamG domain-containing protein [Planctomycetota bacterium]|jgi:hypothetical protein